MKLYLLLIPLLAAMACAPSVSQDEYDGLSSDFRQSQTEVSELKSQLNTAESKLTELEGQVTELTDLQVGLRERLAAAGQERVEEPSDEPTFAEGQATALVKDRIRRNVDFWLGGHWNHNVRMSENNPCYTLALWAIPDIQNSGISRGNATEELKKLRLVEVPELEEGIWSVRLANPNFSTVTHDGPYKWKVYESTGTVERIDVDRDYC